MRPLMARAGRQIVGIAVQKGVSRYKRSWNSTSKRPRALPPDAKVTPFNRVGLITIWESQVGGGTILPDNVTRLRWDEMAVDDVFWRDDGTRFFDAPYWNNPSLRFVEHFDLTDVEWDYRMIDKQLVVHDVLVWARSPAELRQLRNVSIFTTYAYDFPQDRTENSPMLSAYKICGIGVDYAQGHPEGQRIIGLEGKVEPNAQSEHDLADLKGPPVSPGSDVRVGEMKGNGDFRIDFEIDGAGGEVITEVFYGTRGSGRAVGNLKVSWPHDSRHGFSAQAFYQFRTNRGREAGVVLVHGEADWIPFRTPPGRTMIGIITTFASGGGESKAGLTVRHSRRRADGCPLG